MDQAWRHLAHMRLVVEGAIALYEDDSGEADPIIHDLLGEALYMLRVHMRDFQKQYRQETLRQVKAYQKKLGK